MTDPIAVDDGPLDPLEQQLLAGIAALADTVTATNSSGASPTTDDPIRTGSALSVGRTRQLFDAQIASRHLDHAARWLRGRGLGFYTIGSAGHEGNAAVAAALQPTDPALLHYRSGGFYLARARQVDDQPMAGVRDVLAGLLAAADEPIAGGRHKVFGHPHLDVIPQTSTIASHLPRALGVAFAIDRARRLDLPARWSRDAVAVCSFGDASANHSTAQGAINAAIYTAFAGIGVPLLFVCEDNGWGISVPTPRGWIEHSFAQRTGLRYARADGSDVADTFQTASALVDWVREHRRPALLHLTTVRFMGHAGTDVEAGYRSAAAIRADAARDPLLGTARLLVDAGAATPDELRDRYLGLRREVRVMAESMLGLPTLHDVDEVMAPLSPRRPALVLQAAALAAGTDDRRTFFGGTLPEDEGALTLAEQINRTLSDVLVARPAALVFGEDVGVKGGVYGVTRGLQKKAGSARVFDSLLDEQSILGLALGAGVSGLLPIPEIQYLAYLHNAEDQLRGEAASLSFFSQASYTNPMVVRIAGLAYQKGFGGHFHNDNAVAVLRDIPGLVVASPGRPADAAAMLRTCVAAADTDGTVSVFLEPIALYHTRDLHDAGDGGWTDEYVEPDRWSDTHVAIGEGCVARPGDDMVIVTWANGLFLSLRAARRLAGHGISCRVFDLRWLSPLPIEQVVRHAQELGRVLVVDETRHSGGVGEAVLAGLVEHDYHGVANRVAARDSFIPLGDAANLVLVSEDDIVDAALHTMGRGRR